MDLFEYTCRTQPETNQITEKGSNSYQYNLTRVLQ